MKSTIGQNIANYRKKADMTQAELAEKLNVSVQAISKWENDVSHPDIERIGRLARVLNTSAEQIINGEEAVAKAELSGNHNMSKRLFVLTVSVTDEESVDVKLRIPVELVLKSHEDGTLAKLLGESAQIPDTAIEMIKMGVVGFIANIKTEEAEVNIEVVDYDD